MLTTITVNGSEGLRFLTGLSRVTQLDTAAKPLPPALAAMIGAAVILTDPIFQGLAISLLFGLASSTLLTVLVIPAIYIALRGEKRALPAGTVAVPI